MIRKLVLNDGRSERELVLKGTIVVGRDPSCHVNDLDPLLSRRHAEFVSGLQGVYVRDLGSRNGILVNGVKVPESKLKPGDVVQLGHLEMRYVEDASVQAIEHHAKAHATTATGLEAPTMAPAPRPQSPARVVPAAVAPTEAMPAAPSIPVALTKSEGPTGDLDATRAQARTASAPMAAVRASDPVATQDNDETRAPLRKTQPADDFDATMAPSVVSIDETRMPLSRPVAARAQAGAAVAVPAAAVGAEARLVADRSLIVTEATGSCAALLGIRPEAALGGQLTETLARALSFVTSGSGPAALTLEVVRGTSGGTLIIMVKAGQA